MKSGFKALGVQTQFVFTLPVSRLCQIVLFIIADSADDFHPTISRIAQVTKTDRGNIVRQTKKLEEIGYIIRHGKTKDGGTIWHINTAVLEPLLSQFRCSSNNNTSQKVLSNEQQGVLSNEQQGVLSNEQHKPSIKPSNLTFNNIVEETTKKQNEPVKLVTEEMVSNCEISQQPIPTKKKSKPKPKTTSWAADDPLSGIFGLLTDFEPYRKVFDVPTDRSKLTRHMKEENLNYDQMERVVSNYIRHWSEGKQGIPKKFDPRRRLTTFVKNAWSYNREELQRLSGVKMKTI